MKFSDVRLGKAPRVKLPIDLWCRLCDAVCCSPDLNSAEEIVQAVERLAAKVMSK